MGDILIRSIGGTRADSRSWPKTVRGGVVERAPLLLANNLTWACGPPQGREGQASLYQPLGGSSPSTGCNGPVEVFHHTTRPGSDYIITAGYAFALDSGGEGTIALVVRVFADRQVITTKTYALDTQLYREIPRLPTILGFSFGTSFFLTGPGVMGVDGSPVGFLEVKFSRIGARVGEAKLFDRGIVSFGAGDDDGPFASRVERAVAVCVFQGRVVLGVEGGILYSNPFDVGGWPANNFIPTPGGTPSAFGPSDRYLMIYSRTGDGAILRGGMTSIDDTSVDVVTGLPRCASQRSIAVTREGQFVVADDGIFLVRHGGGVTRISGGIDPILRGDAAQLYGFDYSPFVPVRASLVDAPVGWLPQRRELHVALSSGAVGEYPWADAGGEPIIGYGHANARDIGLVAHIPDGALEKPERDIEWSFETGRTAESLCCYTDADGFDVRLSSSHRGRVFLGLCGDVDEIDGLTVVKVEEPSILATAAYGSTMALAPIPCPAAGRVRVQKVDVGFAETRVIDDNETFVVDVAIGAEGATDGRVRRVGLRARNDTPTWGDALPFTLQTTQSRHVAPTLAGAVGGDAVSVRIESVDEPMVPVRGLTLRVQQAERIR